MNRFKQGEALEPLLTALTDNWTLSLATDLLEQAEGKGRAWHAHADDSHWQKAKQALLHLLDLIVLSDEVIHDAELAEAWRLSGVLAAIEPMLTQWKTTEEERKAIIAHQGRDIIPHVDGDHLVVEGGLYYLGIAQLAGCSYWPAPDRAQFVKKWFSGHGAPWSISAVEGRMRGFLEDVRSEVLSDNDVPRSWVWPGFGSLVLASCDTIESIVPCALEVHRSSEAKMFREWLAAMDEAVKGRDLRSIKEKFSEVDEVVDQTRRGLQGEASGFSDSTVTLGLAPTLTFSLSSLKKLMAKNRRPSSERLHMTFMKSYLNESLDAADLTPHLERLFPRVFGGG